MSKVQTNKETLIKKSMLVFMKNGYYHTTLSDLAKACGIEKPHFYYYFKDKKDLMREVLIYASSQIEKLVFDIAYGDKREAPARLHIMLNNVFKIHTRYEYGCLMGNILLETIGNEPYFKPILSSYFDRWRKALVYLYSTSHKENIAIDMAYEDIAKLQGSIMLMRLYNNKNILEKTIEDIKKRI